MAENFLKTGCISMQINRAELQKVRVKLSRDALTIQKEGTSSVSPSSSSPVNQPESTNGKAESLSWKRSPSTSTNGEASSPTQKKPAPPLGERTVKLTKRKVGGLGMSIKGGRESNLPIAISKIYKDQAAYETSQLHEGDIILEVNGQDIRRATHDEAVAVLKKGGSEIELTVIHSSSTNGIVRSVEESSSDAECRENSSQKVIHMGWIWERLRSTNHWNVWKRKFLTVKGSELQVFEMPPVATRDWLKSEVSHNLMELVCHICKEDEQLDKREHCFTVQSYSGVSHYLAVDTEADMTEIVNRVQEATHQAVVQIESRSFPGKWRGQSVKLVFDLKRGLRLYSGTDRSLLWQYRFSFLRGSSDDGARKIVLLFSQSPAGPFDRQELEFTNMQQVLTVMHAFYAAKVAQVDPNFSFENSV
ncbi:gamma-2-syntrophin-like [Stylophora pistillata]|uniref:gamma-2-syntrophin-like n=1 Tax=Stylophora pistillata TaxID=50429 RepID=UPI000C03F0EA|nr:gamma-2-syntrophin-like [Stylophora pistillata]